MSQFTTPAILVLLPKNRFQLYEEFEYHVGELGSNEVIKVPAGFITDLASVPRPMWGILSPYDEYAKASIIHDYLYKTKSKYSRKEIDGIFLEAMTVLGVSTIKKYAVWAAVRLFGWCCYNPQ